MGETEAIATVIKARPMEAVEARVGETMVTVQAILTSYEV